MTDEMIIKALECCGLMSIPCSQCPYFHTEPCVQLKLDALGLINRQKAEILTLQEQVRVLNVPKMALPYDEDEFLRKAILEVIKWIEEIPHYKTFGTIVLTKTRVDEMKDRIKESKNDLR